MSAFIFYAVALHVIWSTSVIFDPSGRNATAVASVYYWFGSLDVVVMLGFAAMAVGGFFARTTTLASVLMLPQQFLLFLSAGGAIQAVVLGHFADGVERPAAFLINDQSPAVLAAVLHSVSIYWVWRGWDKIWNGRK